MDATDLPGGAQDHCTTLEVAKLLGLAVRSVQLMVDRGELQAWKTSGGHRRISRTSVTAWLEARHLSMKPGMEPPPATRPHTRPHHSRPKVMLIEDSQHDRNLIRLLLEQHFPDVELHIADDGIAGLAMVGQFSPQVLIVNIQLPGIDGTTLLTSLRSHRQFSRIQVLAITSLQAHECTPYALGLADMPLIHKPDLTHQLPVLIQQRLQAANA